MGNDRISTYLTIIGKVSIVSDVDAVKAVYFPTENLPATESGTYPVMEEAASQLDEFLSGGRKDFTVPLSASGTKFQEEVWDAISGIPYGSTATYSEIASSIGRPGAARAVGTACRMNRIPFFIPCHRVVSASGIGGYAGGLVLKRKILAIERDFS